VNCISSIFNPSNVKYSSSIVGYPIMKTTNNQLGLISLIKRTRLINLITGPIIYSMIFPIILLDICVSFYQWTCFPIYRIPKFSRKNFIIFDRQELRYLDWVSKFHCSYCAYGVGVIAFVSEVIGATEEYFCPIKHKSKKIFSKNNACKFLGFEESDSFDFNSYLEISRKRQSDKILK